MEWEKIPQPTGSIYRIALKVNGHAHYPLEEPAIFYLKWECEILNFSKKETSKTCCHSKFGYSCPYKSPGGL